MGAFTGTIPGICDYGLTESTVEIAPHDTASPEALSAMILGPIIALVLQRRGLLALHAAGVVRSDGGAILLGGPSGVGKSTLAAALAVDTDSVIGDDLIAVDTRSEPPHAIPSYPESRLWPDVAERYGSDEDGWAIVGTSGKRAFSTAHRFFDAPAPIRDIVTLSLGDSTVMSACSPGEAVMRLFECTWERHLLASDPASARRHFDQVSQLASQVRVWRLTRPPGMERLPEVLAALRAALSGPKP